MTYNQNFNMRQIQILTRVTLLNDFILI